MLRHLAGCSEAEVADIVSQLRLQRRLTRTVRDLNRYLSDPQHSRDALLALRRMGMEYGG